MTATVPQGLGPGRALTVFGAVKTAVETSGDTPDHRDPASAGTARRTLSRRLEAAFARGERAVFDLMRGVRDGLDRRRAVGELRRMGRSRLADLGIEADSIGPVVDAMLAARRDAAARGGETRPRPE